MRKLKGVCHVKALVVDAPRDVDADVILADALSVGKLIFKEGGDI